MLAHAGGGAAIFAVLALIFAKRQLWPLVLVILVCLFMAHLNPPAAHQRAQAALYFDPDRDVVGSYPGAAGPHWMPTR